MICNKCQKEMPDFGDFCPYCGSPKATLEEEIVAVEEVAAEEIAVSEETAEEAPVEEVPAEEISEEEAAAEETPTEEAVAEEAPPQETEKKESAVAVLLSQVKQKLAQFFNKVRITVPQQEEEKPAQEEAPAPAVVETAAEQAPVVEVPVRRRPSDAFIIDFPVEEEKKEEPEETAQQAPEEEVAVVETAEEAAPAPEAVPAKKKVKPLYLALIIAGCVILLAGLVFAVLVGMGVKIGPRENDLYYRDSYTVDEKTLTKKAGDVVATIGDRQLTVSQLQMYYIESIYNFYSQNYYYMSMLGIDAAAPLDQQECAIAEGVTWEQYFLDTALQTWQSYIYVEMMAEQDAFVIPEEIQAQMDQMTAQLESIALAYGHANAAEYLGAEVAPGVTLEDYVHFNNVYLICNQYINDFYTKDLPTAADIQTYYANNESLFASNGITEDMGLLSSVRHILIQPQGGTTDETGETTYSEEEWAAALAEAERILEEWKTGEATEESFAELANTYSMDGGSNTTGGLYEDISIDASYVEEFRAWAVDSARQTGDTEIVKTTFGYHIMYFVEGEDYFSYVVSQQLIADRIQDRLTALREAYPVEIDYKKVVLGEESFS